MAAVKRRVDVIEEVPDVADNNATNLILRYNAVHNQAEGHQNPGKIWRGEDQYAEETESSVWVAATPDVDQARGEGGA
jgi:hypothetical protein